MKEVIFLVLAGCSLVLATQRCCPNFDDILISGGVCGESREKMLSMNCSNGRMVLRDVVLDGDKVSTLDSPGYIFVEDPKEYCLGEMYRNTSDITQGTVPVAVVCFEKVNADTSYIETTGILTLISVFFLVLTTAFYAYLPQLRDLQGKCYLCMCISMALGFLSLGVLQLSPGFVGQICTITGFLVYTWMMATFFWMNVISINVFRTVLDANYMKKTERKQYFLYSCYAWGLTILFLIITVITDLVDADWKPGFGDWSCWFSGRKETWIFFYGPIAVLVSANVILFGLSSFHLWQETRKYEVNNLNKLKHKFLLSLKLFLVMGISWIFEIASFAHGGQHIIWQIMDTFNCLQGVVIFLLLVIFRRRAMKGLVSESLCLWFSRPMADKLSPNDDSEDQNILGDDTVEVRLH